LPQGITDLFGYPNYSETGPDRCHAPEASRFTADGDASLDQNIVDITVTQVESIVEPDGVGDDVWGEAVSFIGVHPEIVSQGQLIWQYPS